MLYAAGQVFPGWFWQETLAELGPKPPWFQALRAYLIGHLGKYVPGKATVILIRAGLLRGSSTSATAATLGVFYETLSTLALGACLAALILALRFSQHAWLILISCGMACVIGLPTLPPVFRRMVQFTRVGRLNPAVAEQAARLDYRLLGLAWLMLPWSWLLQGLSLWATLQAGGYASELGIIDQIAVCIATIAIATAAGFLSFIPGGLVVREGVLLELLAPWFGEEERSFRPSCRVWSAWWPSCQFRVSYILCGPPGLLLPLKKARMLSTVIPVYNEVESLEALYRELDEVARNEGYPLDLIFVDDGSTDGSWDVVRRLAEADPRVQRLPLPPQFRQSRSLERRLRQRARRAGHDARCRSAGRPARDPSLSGRDGSESGRRQRLETDPARPLA